LFALFPITSPLARTEEVCDRPGCNKCLTFAFSCYCCMLLYTHCVLPQLLEHDVIALHNSCSSSGSSV